MTKKILYLFIFLFYTANSYAQEKALVKYPTNYTIQSLKDSPKDKIWVVAHRGDWRNAPENSLQAVENCIQMGVDMVEIDVQLTKDAQVVLMHDGTIDRTTNGKGKVKDWTLDSLKMLKLKDGLGIPTFHQIPTLEEVLLLCKGKILINIDKGFDIFRECYELAKKTGTLNQLVLKTGKPYKEVKTKLGDQLNEVAFMPIIAAGSTESLKILEGYMKHYKQIAIEFTIKKGEEGILKEFEGYRNQGVQVWVNSLWSRLNGGHDDEMAALNPTVYDWYLNNHVSMIQTDRPQLLINYLKLKGRF